MNVGDVDLNLLRTFDAILREGSVTAAGARLSLSQPAMSNALSRLRAVFEDPLFVRTPRGMQPTPFAESLAGPISQALALIERTLAQRSGFEPARSERSFRFHMSDIGEMLFLPPLLERLAREAPGIRVETTAFGEERIADALASGEIDLAVGFLPGLRAPVRNRALFSDAYLCLLRADHTHIGKTLSREQFLAASHALISSIGSGHRVVEDALVATGIRRRISLRVPHFMVVPMLLERTDLIVTVPERAAAVFERLGKLKLLRPPVAIPRTDVRVHWHERFERDPASLWMRELLFELIADSAPRRKPAGFGRPVSRSGRSSGARPSSAPRGPR